MIKKIIPLFIFIYLLPAKSVGQNRFQQEIAVGGSVGASFSQVSFNPRIQENMLMTFNMGFTARWISENHCGLQFELNYAQSGWSIEFENSANEYTRRLNYIEMPLLSHFYFGRKARFFFNLGPQIGYMLGESTSSSFGAPDDMGPNREVILDEVYEKSVENKLGWGLCGGPGVEIRTGIGNFLIEGRYYYSLGDIYKSRRTDFFAKSSPQIISAKITYLLPIYKSR